MNVIYTIGYGGRSPAIVTALLKEHDVAVLVDVRASPRSRVPGFNKNSLAQHMEACGITYHHVEALGNANRNAGPDAPVHLVDEATGLRVLRELLDQQAVAIMCAERDHRGCHRTYIAERMPECQIVNL